MLSHSLSIYWKHDLTATLIGHFKKKLWILIFIYGLDYRIQTNYFRLDLKITFRVCKMCNKFRVYYYMESGSIHKYFLLNMGRRVGIWYSSWNLLKITKLIWFYFLIRREDVSLVIILSEHLRLIFINCSEFGLHLVLIHMRLGQINA